MDFSDIHMEMSPYPGNMCFIKKDGTLREGHEAFFRNIHIIIQKLFKFGAVFLIVHCRPVIRMNHKHVTDRLHSLNTRFSIVRTKA